MIPTETNAIYTLVELQKLSGAVCGVEKLILTTSNQYYPKGKLKTERQSQSHILNSNDEGKNVWSRPIPVNGFEEML